MTMVTRRENPEVKAVDKSVLARFFHIYICRHVKNFFICLHVNNKRKGLHMIDLKLTPHQASVVWAALLVAEDNALSNAEDSIANVLGSVGNARYELLLERQKALDMANELRALRYEITLRREALREQA